MKSLKTIVEKLSASSAAIMAPNDAEQHMYCYDSFNMPPEWVAIKNPYDQYTNKGNVHVLKTGKTVINNGSSSMFHGYYVESVLIIPIVRMDKVIGTLEIIHSEPGKRFNEADLRAALEFAKYIEIKSSS